MEKKLTFGFYGGIANNMYVAAKAFYKNRINTLFIRDMFDNFPFSQPVWEDCKFYLEYELIDSTKWSIKKWNEKEEKLQWVKPDFVVVPQSNSNKNIKISSDHLYQRLLVELLYYKSPYFYSVIELMKNCDVIFVCGIDATIIAYFSGKPYVIWPHGADIRLASGYQYQLKNFLRKESAVLEIKRKLLQKAYNNAILIGGHDPTKIGGEFCKGILFEYEYLPLPLPFCPKCKRKEERDKNLQGLFKSLNISIPPHKKYIFIPSRIDYFWKGTDILLDAIESVNPKNIHFIFSGWGNDFRHAKNKLTKSSVTFLPFAISKGLLFEIFHNVDLVIDQFKLGTYGTSALEAMSVGTPVMMYIEEQNFLEKGWLAPPVINAKTKEKVCDVIYALDEDSLNLSEFEMKCKEWFKRTHWEKICVPFLLDKIKERLVM